MTKKLDAYQSNVYLPSSEAIESAIDEIEDKGGDLTVDNIYSTLKGDVKMVEINNYLEKLDLFADLLG